MSRQERTPATGVPTGRSGRPADIALSDQSWRSRLPATGNGAGTPRAASVVIGIMFRDVGGHGYISSLDDEITIRTGP